MSDMISKISVMQSFDGGKKIQQKAILSGEDWRDVAKPSWNWDKNDYRVKPKGLSVIKKTEFMIKDFSEYNLFVLSVDEYGKVIASNNLYDFLMENRDKKVVMRVYNESIKLQEKNGVRNV